MASGISLPTLTRFGFPFSYFGEKVSELATKSTRQEIISFPAKNLSFLAFSYFPFISFRGDISELSPLARKKE